MAQPTLARRPFALTATMIITRTRARPTATTARNGLWMECSSERGRGITGITGIVAFTAEATTVVATMAAGFTNAEASAGAAGTMTVFEAEDSIMKDSNTMAFMAANSMVEASSTDVDFTMAAVFMVAADSTAVAGMADTAN